MLVLAHLRTEKNTFRKNVMYFAVVIPPEKPAPCHERQARTAAVSFAQSHPKRTCKGQDMRVITRALYTIVIHRY